MRDRAPLPPCTVIPPWREREAMLLERAQPARRRAREIWRRALAIFALVGAGMLLSTGCASMPRPPQ
jgi:hypothetical protein